MGVYRCEYCQKYVQWLFTRFNKRMLFDGFPVPVQGVPEEIAWMPGRWTITYPTRTPQVRTAMAPMTHYSRDKRAIVRRVMVLHHCPEREVAHWEAGLDEDY